MKQYFEQLNYSMANEDTTLEYLMAHELKAQRILAVGGSGSRSLPFLALPIKELRIVDVSQDQIYFIKVKLETIRKLTREECITFWTGVSYETRRRLFEKLELSPSLYTFFDYHLIANQTLPPLYWGKWERTFHTFSKLTAFFFSEDVRKGLFEATNPFSYFKENIEGWKWSLLLKIVGNKAMFNSLLYKGSFIKKNSPLSYFEYYRQAFERLFQLNIKRSHFLQLCFFGKLIYNEGLPIEFSEDLFDKIKHASIEPIWETGSIFNRNEGTHYDLISLSDVPSYLEGEIERGYIQSLKKNLSAGGFIINRHYLRQPEETNKSDFRDVTTDFKELILQELVQMYDVEILRHVPDKV
jgi:S-adenosylmethionine-diacylglycerol 3-amino-3-carboxypropyl transferase